MKGCLAVYDGWKLGDKCTFNDGKSVYIVTEVGNTSILISRIDNNGINNYITLRLNKATIRDLELCLIKE